ncbi:MAG: hypothetical protein PW734_00415 [Verrucomicrobium sp.]|nr:hypothetical protein [Verrucomicrobium sp.]
MIQRLLFLFLAASSVARAVQPEEIVYSSYPDFAAGNLRSVTLSDLGVLAAAPGLKEIASLPPLDAEQIWALLPDGAGYYAATSPKGLLFRVTPGKAEVAAKFAENNLYALARNGKGDLFVGTSPDGKIYRLSPGGKPEVYFEPKAKYIWALAFDAQGNLYAATGTEGKIFKITGAGKGSVFCATDEVHVRSLAFAPDGALLAGTAETGTLYRIAPDGSAVALVSTGRQEVDRIVVLPDGVVYFSAAGSPRASAPRDGGSKGGGNKDGLPPSLVAGSENRPAPSGPRLPKPTFAGGQLDEGNTASQVWRLDASLYPQAIWSTPETILTLDRDGEGVRVGTASNGALYRLDARGRATQVLKLNGPSLTAAAPDKAGFSLASSNPARVYRLEDSRPMRDPGVYESDVVDSHGFAQWGALRAEGTGLNAFLFTRSGNTPRPDKSWYPWVPLRDALSASPPARYFQFKIEIATGTVDRVDLSYLPKNLPPKIAQVEILPPGVGYAAVEPPQPPPQARSAEQILLSAVSGPEEGGFAGNGGGNIRYQPSFARGYRTAVWKASDPNRDTLRYALYYRSTADSAWRELAKDLDGTVFSWDASGWPDGRYYLKVVASDEKDNLPGKALTDELPSRLFLVDNTPPAITVSSGDSRQVSFLVSKEGSGIDNVSVSTNGSDFKVLQPADGVVDPRRQRFSYKLEAGQVLFIRAEDQAGNVSSAQVKP